MTCFPFNTVELSFKEKSEVMRWMIDGQLGRRNLSPVQRISVAKKYGNKLREKARENQENRNDLLSNWTESKAADPSETRKEIANLANVGTGTLARYDIVMKSDDDNIKKEMLEEKITINKAYDTVKQKQPKVENIKDTLYIKK